MRRGVLSDELVNADRGGRDWDLQLVSSNQTITSYMYIFGQERIPHPYPWNIKF